MTLEEIELDQYFSKKDLGARGRWGAKRIIIDSIKDHLIPHVSSLKTPKGSVWFYEEAIVEE